MFYKVKVTSIKPIRIIAIRIPLYQYAYNQVKNGQILEITTSSNPMILLLKVNDQSPDTNSEG